TLPGEDFRIFDESPPERHERAVTRTLPRAQRGDPRLERGVALARALGIDAGGARSVGTVRAETTGRGWIRTAAVAPTDGVVERTLPLAAPHQPIDVVRAQIILDEREPEVSRVRIAHADAGGRPSVEVDLDRLVEPLHVGAEDILEPADHLHAALAR